MEIDRKKRAKGTGLRVLLYARSARANDEAINAQVEKLRAYAEENSLQVVGEFVDNGYSGRNFRRPAFKEMMSVLAEPGEVDAVIVCKTSRIASHVEDRLIFKRLLREKGIKLTVVDQTTDDSPESRFLESIIETLDSFIDPAFGERVRAGMRENAQRGSFNGGKPPFGYTTERVEFADGTKSRLVMDPKTSDIVRRIFSMCADGKTPAQIAAALNEPDDAGPGSRAWTARSVRRTLTDSVYVGDLVWGRTRGKNGVRPLEPDFKIIHDAEARLAVIDRQTFNKVQDKLRETAHWKKKEDGD